MCEARFEATVQTEWKLCMWLTPVQREKRLTRTQARPVIAPTQSR